uniref:Uncharacterized protein n=1 Tax=Arundo donax TaxID=35708 RepID=A0A0A9DYY2_ARUDO
MMLPLVIDHFFKWVLEIFLRNFYYFCKVEDTRIHWRLELSH